MSLAPLASQAKTKSAEPLVQRKRDCCADETSETGLPRFLGGAQAKLAVGARDDPFEREADAISQAVTRGESLSPRYMSAGAPAVQRLCAECAEEQGEEETDVVQRDAAQAEGVSASNHAQASPGNGAPLAPPVRERLESSMGLDLSSVRVHSDPGSRSLARSLNAKAFTHGNDIWIGPQQSADDVSLMAHEVAHVVQQTSGRATPDRVQRAPADYRHPEDGGGVAARMQAKISKEVDDSDSDDGGGGDGKDATDGATRQHEARSATSKIDRGELATKRAEVEPGARPDVDRPAAEAPKVQEAKAEVQAEASTPGEPIAEGKGKGGGGPAAGGEAAAAAGAAAGLAEAAAGGGGFAGGGGVTMVVPPAPVVPADKGGQPLPASPDVDAQVASLAQAAQSMRSEGSRVRSLAAEERANAGALSANIGLVQSGVAQATAGVAKSNAHLAFRRDLAGKAREGLAISEEKAATVAAEAPNYSSKADEGKAESGPMASEAGSLSAENAANTPDDPEAAAKAAEQGGQMNQAGADIGTTDSAISQTQTKAGDLAAEAAQAQQTNTATRGKLDGMDATLASTGDKLAQMSAQNADAQAQAQALASAPQQQTQAAGAIDERGASIMSTSDDMEQRLHAVQQNYAAAMAAVPAEEEPPPMPAEDEAPAPEQAAPTVVQRTPEAANDDSIDGVVQLAPDSGVQPPENPRPQPEPPAEEPDAGGADAGAAEEEPPAEEPPPEEPAVEEAPPEVEAEAAPPEEPEAFGPPTAEEAAAAAEGEGGGEGEGEEALPAEEAPQEEAGPAPGERKKIDLAGDVAKALPSWLTGVETPNEKQRAEAVEAANAKRAAEIEEIEKSKAGGFDALSATDKMGIALRLTGRNLFGSVGNIKWPGIGHLAIGIIDPRGPLMGVVSGLGMMVSGAANLFSAEQWSKDPLGNLLKSAADIATGLTIILGSITALAGVIIAIMTAITILSLGTAAPITGPVIAFCTTVLTTVGGWTIAVGKVALVLQALVFIKNLIDAACASTAAELQGQADKMTENAGDAANVLMQMGMAKASQMGAKAATAEIQAAGGGVKYAAQMGAKAGVGLRSGVGAVGRGAKAVGKTIMGGPKAIAGAVGRGVAAGGKAVGKGIVAGAKATGKGIVAGAKAVGKGLAAGGKAVASGAKAVVAGAKALPGKIVSGAKAVAGGVKALPGKVVSGAKALASGAKALPGKIASGVKAIPGKLGKAKDALKARAAESRKFLVGEGVEGFKGARAAAKEARKEIWDKARAPGGPLAGTTKAVGEAAEGAEAKAVGVADDTQAAAAADDAKAAGAADEAKAGKTAAADDAAKAENGKVPNEELTPQQAGKEVDDLANHPEQFEGTPPNRQRKMGDHEWREQPDGSFCRFSPTRYCVDSPKLRNEYIGETRKTVDEAREAVQAAEKRAQEAKQAAADAAEARKLEDPADIKFMRDSAREADKKAAQAGKEFERETKAAKKLEKQGKTAEAKAARERADAAGKQREQFENEAQGWRNESRKPQRAKAEWKKAKAQEARAAKDLEELEASLKRQESYAKELDDIAKREQEIIHGPKAKVRHQEPPMASAEGKELMDLRAKAEKLKRQLSDEIESAKGFQPGAREALRGGTPFKGAGGTERRIAFQKAVRERYAAEGRNPAAGHGIDYVTGEELPYDLLSPDHITPVAEIMDMPGFGRLPRADQLEILDMPENMAWLRRSLNSSKQDARLAEWAKSRPDLRGTVDVSKLRQIEADARAAVKAEIAARLKRLQGP
ncbi:MAG TPA: DUF4157 domain-containing protein [Burkholderiales bacterium]|nr:DUF4157 domain-containing protein [Burkholderiales bacterium]